MRIAVPIAFAAGGLLLLSACQSDGGAASMATQAATPSSVFVTPTAALNTPAQSSPAQSASPQVSATVQTRVITSSRSISFSTVRVNDSELAQGATEVRKKGVPGVETLTYKVTFVNGVQTRKVLTGRKVVKKAVSEVIAVGTKETQQCDPNYSGACVPIASDVDCAGGSGNGPAYVQGPVRVVGKDIYGLDRDGDGIGCEDG